jgi:hypothetical protein
MVGRMVGLQTSFMKRLNRSRRLRLVSAGVKIAQLGVKMGLSSPARGYTCQRAENNGPSHELQSTVRAEYIFSPSRDPHLAV